MSRPPPRPALCFRDRALDSLASYLPLLLMALLALGSWWLVSGTALPAAAPRTAPLRHVADYSMTGFTVQRFASDGRLSGQISGDTASHFPDTDTLEIDNPRLHAISIDGLATDAAARHAVSSDEGNVVQLIGDARVIRQAAAGQPPIEFSGEQLHADFNRERVDSQTPVRLSQGGATWTADAFEYDHRTQRVQLRGAMRAVFPPSASRR